MRIRENSEYAKSRYFKEVCIVNHNPWDILGPLIETHSHHIFGPSIESQSQGNGENDDFCGLASFGNTVKDLLSEIQAKEGMDRAEEAENKPPVYCSFAYTSGVSCGVEAIAGSQYCETHVQVPVNSSTPSGSGLQRGAKKANTRTKRKVDSSPGDDILYYAGFPGLRRKRGRPQPESEATIINIDE